MTPPDGQQIELDQKKAERKELCDPEYHCGIGITIVVGSRIQTNVESSRFSSSSCQSAFGSLPATFHQFSSHTGSFVPFSVFGRCSINWPCNGSCRNPRVTRIHGSPARGRHSVFVVRFIRVTSTMQTGTIAR